MTTIEVMFADILLSYKLYVIVGGAAIITNATIVIIFWSSPTLRIKYQMLTALAIANLINGVGFVFSGAIKEGLLLSVVNLQLPMGTAWDCAMQPYPGLQIVGAQWPACITLLLGIEHFTAVHYPIWYKINVNAKVRFQLVLASLAFSLASLGVGYLQTYIFFRNTSTYSLCTISGAFDKYYTTWNYIVTVFGHLIAFFLNASAFLTAKSKARLLASGLSFTMNKEIYKEITMVRLMLSLAAFSVLLISVPNIILWGQSWLWAVDFNALGYIYVSFCANSAINIFIYIFFNKDFRGRLFYLMTCGRAKKAEVAVESISMRPAVNSINSRASFTQRRSTLMF